MDVRCAKIEMRSSDAGEGYRLDGCDSLERDDGWLNADVGGRDRVLSVKMEQTTKGMMER